MVVGRRYVRKYVVGRSGISDFFSKALSKICRLFSRVKPIISRAANTGVSKTVVSAGEQVAVERINGVKDHIVEKIKGRQKTDTVNKIAAALAQSQIGAP